ncbi:MAG TPA: hypothetical protein VIV60_17995 [Polyangiaceae bacterium]
MPCTVLESLALLGTPFIELPSRVTAQVFGVRYVQVVAESGDELFLTERGWPWLRELLPERWYCNGYYRTTGVRLGFSTGTVYRVRLIEPRRLEVVVKFSRIGQHLERGRLTQALAGDPDYDPSFGSPFEEIAMLERLRTQTAGPRVLTKRALAVLSPSECFEDWELGRVTHCFQRHARRLNDDQSQLDASRRVALKRHCDYLIVYQWMRGLNLEECIERGIVDHIEADAINRMVQDDLHRAGFDVLDHKPNHVILSPRRDGSLLKRHGRVVYGLADFELLVPRSVSVTPSPRALATNVADHVTAPQSCESIV